MPYEKVVLTDGMEVLFAVPDAETARGRVTAAGQAESRAAAHAALLVGAHGLPRRAVCRAWSRA